MTLELFNYFLQIVVYVSVIISSYVWSHLFKKLLKDNMQLNFRIEMLEHRIRIIDNPYLRGQNEM